MAKLMAAVSNLSSTDHGSENHDHAGCHNHDYIDRELKWQNLEIPIFDGEDVFGQTNKVERYFEIKGVKE